MSSIEHVGGNAKVKESIEHKLSSALQPVMLEVINESDNHNVPPDSETHFKVIAASAEFMSLRPVQRHQRVYGILRDELANGVHALALHLYTPEEWQKQHGVAQSPPCMGGG